MRFTNYIKKSPVFLLFCLLLLFIGCATQRDTFEIIEKTELPLYEGEPVEEPITLRVQFEVLKDGSVVDVRLLSKSEDSNWDHAVADSMKNWKFSSHESDSSVWVQKNIRVQLLPSYILNLGELSIKNEQDANILYSRLRAGVSFQQLAKQVQENSSTGMTSRYLNEINTSQYPSYVSKILIELEVGEISRPVQIGEDYVIFKRFGDNNLPG
ncbi:MAG: TonB family protein [Balneolales bacterium]